MGIDLRIPIGVLLGIIGLLLAGYGLVSDSAIYGRSLGININLVWGSALTVFGALLLFAARRSRPS